MTHNIAILGTESSGKTILATVWARQLAYSPDDRFYLNFGNIATQRYTERAWEDLNNEQWVPSTPQGKRDELEWELRLGSHRYPVRLIDLPGQDLRNFFNGNYSTLSTDARVLCDYISSAFIVFVVVNLEKMLKEPQVEDRAILSEIVNFLLAHADTQHICFVFTAWDQVAPAILDEYGDLETYIQRNWTPFYNKCAEVVREHEKGIYFLAVAPVAQTEYKGGIFVPKRNFKSYNLDTFTKVLIKSIVALQKGTGRLDCEEEDIYTHPDDEQLLKEWRRRGWNVGVKNLWDKLLKFLGIKKHGQETIEKIASNLGDVTDGIGAWNTFTERYAQFTGRARRREYWSFSIPTTILMFVLFSLCANYPFIPLIYTLIIAIPSFAVAVRRMHDIGKSGWWILISLVPYVGGIILFIMLCLDGQPHGNGYGPNPKNNS
jgi:uncharacterized membrane protein YhaH (DUF805 family)